MWSTDANDDWNLDDYNRRGNELDKAVETDLADASHYLEIPDGNGGTTRIPAVKDSTMHMYDFGQAIHDTVYVIEQYQFCDRIRRFHNPYFGYYRYSPWYDVAYYDPFYWDYCYYDPWWYVTPSFGFHYGSWYWGWDYGYYTGWYGGWYCPYYHPYPHYYYPSYSYGGGGGYYAGGGIRRGNGRRDGFYGSRNNSGGHFASRGGWRGDGGKTRATAAGTNRSYRNGNGGTTLLAGSTVRGRNTSGGRATHSNMRINDAQMEQLDRSTFTDRGHRASTTATTQDGGRTMRAGTGATATHRTASADNSTSRRISAGVRQSDRGATIHSTNRTAATTSGDTHSHSTYNSSRSYGGNSSSHVGGSSSSSSRSSSYGGGSSHSSGGGSYSGGGGSRGGGGSTGGGGGRSGRR